jgi:Ca2+-binding RTX toxin-like protein
MATVRGKDASADLLYGTSKDDTIDGYGGNDEIHGGAGDDLIRGGDGVDKLFGDGGDDRIWGGNGNDELHGGTGNDLLRGDAGADTLFGDDGNDDISGGDGNDVINGGSGADTIYGDFGADVLIGGAGADVFLFQRWVDSTTGTLQGSYVGLTNGIDQIVDFNPGDGDTINLAAIDAVDSSPFDQYGQGANESFTLVTAFSGHGGELTLTYDAATNSTTLSADANGDTVADLQIIIGNGDFTSGGSWLLL